MKVYRSPLKLFVFGIVGIVLMIGAADVMFGFWVSVEPDRANGVLSTRGLAQQRGDLLLGGSMLVIGVILFFGSVAQLLRRQPILEVSDEGLGLDGGSDGGALISWGGVRAISSAVANDRFDGSPREQLVVDLVSGYMPPSSRVELDVVDSKVTIDAYDWSVPVTEVVLAAQGALDHAQRVEAAASYEPPSVVWEEPSNEGDESEEPEDGDSKTSGTENDDVDKNDAETDGAEQAVSDVPAEPDSDPDIEQDATQDIEDEVVTESEPDEITAVDESTQEEPS